MDYSNTLVCFAYPSKQFEIVYDWYSLNFYYFLVHVGWCFQERGP